MMIIDEGHQKERNDGHEKHQDNNVSPEDPIAFR